jgi:hypothetical protein
MCTCDSSRSYSKCKMNHRSGQVCSRTGVFCEELAFGTVGNRCAAFFSETSKSDFCAVSQNHLSDNAGEFNGSTQHYAETHL